jgi:hypothetical protein
MRWLASFWLIFLAGGLLAQPLRLGGPSSGYVYDERTHALRPVIGVAGAALLGQASLGPAEFAAAAPSGAWVYVLRDGVSIFLYAPPGAEPVEFTHAALLGGADRIVWSRDARWAVLQSSEQGLIQRVALRETVVEPHAPLECACRVLAVSPSGGEIIAAAAGELISVSETGAIARLAVMEAPSAAIFSRDATTLYAADAASGRVLAFRGGARSMEFAAGAEGAQPVGLALSSDDEFLFVADRAAAAVRLIETRTAGLAGEIALERPPAGLELLREDLFLVRGAPGAAELYLLDARRRAVFFLPELDAAEQ